MHTVSKLILKKKNSLVHKPFTSQTDSSLSVSRRPHCGPSVTLWLVQTSRPRLCWTPGPLVCSPSWCATKNPTFRRKQHGLCQISQQGRTLRSRRSSIMASFHTWLICLLKYVLFFLMHLIFILYSLSLFSFFCRVITRPRKRLCGLLPILPVGAPFSRWLVLFKPMFWSHFWICFPPKMPKQSLSFWMPLLTSSWWEVMSNVCQKNWKVITNLGIISVSNTGLAFWEIENSQPL